VFSEVGIASCSSEVKGVHAFLSSFHPLGFPFQNSLQYGRGGVTQSPQIFPGALSFYPFVE
jgi:hypothetical protein